MASMWAALGAEAIVLAGIAGVITRVTRTNLRASMRGESAQTVQDTMIAE